MITSLWSLVMAAPGKEYILKGDNFENEGKKRSVGCKMTLVAHIKIHWSRPSHAPSEQPGKFFMEVAETNAVESSTPELPAVKRRQPTSQQGN